MVRASTAFEAALGVILGQASMAGLSHVKRERRTSIGVWQPRRACNGPWNRRPEITWLSHPA
jgi:hypothetical protein